MKKKLIRLANKTSREIYELKDNEVKTHCRYCGLNFSECYCHRTEHVFDETQLKCILCHEPFKPNGTGPSNNKFLHGLINLFFFNRWVTNISNKHDVGYFEGFTKHRKRSEDNAMRRRTYEKIDSTWWLRPKWLWKKRADANWLAVNKCGESSFNWSGCVLPENTSEFQKINN